MSQSPHNHSRFITQAHLLPNANAGPQKPVPMTETTFPELSREAAREMAWGVIRKWRSPHNEPDDAGTLASLIATALVGAEKRVDLSKKQRYANHYEEQIGFLVERFADALSAKLRKAEEKYQYQGAWRRDNWRDALAQQIRRHMDKGDPLDVAAYCAFAWHHGWSLDVKGDNSA